MKIHLCTPYFRSANAERQAEFDACLKGNVENPHIDQITLFIDDGHEPPFRHEKLRVIDIDGRLTYRDWLEFALEASGPEISVLSNTDIMFDETVAQLHKVFAQKNRFVALSRHEKIGDGLGQHPNPKWSQDVWAIRTDDEVTAEFRRDAGFMLGVPRCDNKIIYEAAVHGWDVVNPFPAVRAIHFHESQIRGYHKTQDRTLIGGMGFAYPCATEMGRSKVELSVWPLKTGNITSVRVVGALEDWAPAPDPSATGGVEPIAAYDADWQYPAITEKQAFDQMRVLQGLIPGQEAYLGFPWATLIDKLVNRPGETKDLLRQLDQIKQEFAGRKRIVTVCQHIQMLRFQAIFAQAGITDIFWTHKILRQDHLPDHPHVKLHAFPLFPVQVDGNEQVNVSGRRRFLFSFVGARARDFYLTQVRTYILEELSNHPSGHVVGRGDWHYNKIVYDHQILGRAKNEEALVNDLASLEFTDTLRESDFSLCPSGSGPNSIRLWESIGAGAIPVIMADTLELPGPRALWEQAAVFCAEEREAVQALPERLEAIAADEGRMREMRHAGRQLWILYGPQFFMHDVAALFVNEKGSDSVAGEPSLHFSDTEFIRLASDVSKYKEKTGEADAFFLLTAASHALLRPKSFLRVYNRHGVMKKGIDAALKRREGEHSADLWRRAQEKLKSIDDTGDRALCDPVLSIMAVGRNANRSPLAYPSYRSVFANRLQYVEQSGLADVLVFAASANIREHYAEALKGRPDAPNDKLAILSEEPLWDTTWGCEFDAAHAKIDFWKHEFDYAVLNHLTTDIFRFDKIPYFVTTEDKYAVRYAHFFRRNAAMSPQELLELWRAAPVHQAYFAEKREGGRYEIERPELDLYGYCGYRTRLAGAAKGGSVLRVGMGWNDSARRQELPDWHLDKIAALDRRTFICSALENTHLPDYITEKPFDAFAALAVPVYAASKRHRITEIVPEGSFINIFGHDAEAAAEQLAAFEPDLDFAARYLEAQKRLADLFGNVETLRAERRRVVEATVAALEAVRRGEFAGLRTARAPYLNAETASAGRA